jgi:hypothetical protein
MTWGNVRLAAAPGSHRRNQTIAKVDSLGYFSVALKDSANVNIVVDCVLDGMAVKTVNYADTLIIFTIQTECKGYNAERAKKDIENNQQRLLCHLGYATYHFSEKDSAFEKKYGVSYYTFADMPIQADCMYLYNKTVAEYLDKKYGKAWRTEVRWDVPLD